MEQITFGDVIDFSPSVSRGGAFLAFDRSLTTSNHDCRSIWVMDLVSGMEYPIHPPKTQSSAANFGILI